VTDATVKKETSGQMLLTVNETAQTLGVCRATVNKLLRAGVLPKLKIGNCTRISSKSLSRYVDALEKQAKEQAAQKVKGNS